MSGIPRTPWARRRWVGLAGRAGGNGYGWPERVALAGTGGAGVGLAGTGGAGRNEWRWVRRWCESASRAFAERECSFLLHPEAESASRQRAIRRDVTCAPGRRRRCNDGCRRFTSAHFAPSANRLRRPRAPARPGSAARLRGESPRPPGSAATGSPATPPARPRRRGEGRPRAKPGGGITAQGRSTASPSSPQMRGSASSTELPAGSRR